MIYLDSGSKIIYETLEKYFNDNEPNPVRINGGDFDGTKFLIDVREKDSPVVDICMYVYGDETFKKYGAIDGMKKQFPELEITGEVSKKPEDSVTYSFCVSIDTQKEKANQKKWLQELPRIKVHFMSALFKYAMDEHAKSGSNLEPIRVPYRPEENVYIVSYSGKSLVMVYSILFRDPDDVVLANGFLTEFKDAKKDRSLGGAPSMWFSEGQLPGELSEISDKITEPKDEKTLSQQGWGFISIGLMDSHIKGDAQLKTIELLTSFRSYLHYHLKCMKAYMHIKMRDRVSTLMNNLNASKDQSGKTKEKKTISGKTMKSH